MPEAWYKDGLRFTCTQCGNCCTGAPGYVWISDGEIAVLAKRVGLDEASFRRKYTRQVGNRGTSLVEKADNACVFFATGKGCTVYQDRPKQCRTWPFWKPLLRSQADWDAAGQGCPGIGRGKRHDAAAIAATAADDGLA
jgi:hypothetical protein